MPRESNSVFTSGDHTIRGGEHYATLNLVKSGGNTTIIQTTPNSSKAMLVFAAEGKTIGVPKKTGTLMVFGDCGFGDGGRVINIKSTEEFLQWLRNEYVSEIYRNDSYNGYSHMYGSSFKMRTHDTWGNISISYAGHGVRFAGGNKMASHIYNVWTDKNTTVVDGFLKKASPIIKITDTGAFETNDESDGARVERLSEGVYLIKNVLGFNADAAWGGIDGGIEIPLCKNKLPLIWVDYRVLPDGIIKIMTYHREHADAPAFARNIREGYADGDPIDIPSGRFISVRVQMPENSVWNLRQGEDLES